MPWQRRHCTCPAGVVVHCDLVLLVVAADVNIGVVVARACRKEDDTPSVTNVACTVSPAGTSGRPVTAYSSPM